MELGEKLLQARQEAGLSQRQLCGDVITRNMLSQIEHGTARPSMATLRYLAARLGKPVSYFMDEDAELSPNQGLMAHARRAYTLGNWEEVRTILAGFAQPDESFDIQYRYLYTVTTLRAARDAIGGQKLLYARQLLADLEPVSQPFPGLERSRVLLLASVSDSGLPDLCAMLPDLDEELTLRAQAAMEAGQWQRAQALLDAMESRDLPRWHLLAGKAQLGRKAYAEAAEHLQKAEDAFPSQTAPLLEQCFRELGDYKQAYFYACKQRKG